jgi:hypothetical protein
LVGSAVALDSEGGWSDCTVLVALHELTKAATAQANTPTCRIPGLTR